MNNTIRVLTLTVIYLAILSFAFSQGSGQVSDEEMTNLILDEIGAESEQLQVDVKAIEDIKRRIDELKNRSQGVDRINKMIADNDQAGLRAEFDNYSKRLEELFVTDTAQAEKLLKEMQNLFKDITFLQGELYYYTGALEYYKNNDYAAIEILDPFFVQYPASHISHKALAIILKSLININQEARAEKDYIDYYKDIKSPEIYYLSGHIYYNQAKDEPARSAFTVSAQDATYGQDSRLMLALIDALSSPTPETLAQFENLDRAYANNPFILLALARIYVLSGDWAKAEETYQRYYALSSDNRGALASYERILTLLNSGKQDEAFSLLEELIQKKDAGEFYTTFLYIWAEIQTDKGKRQEAMAKLNEHLRSIADNRDLLPKKLEVMSRLTQAKEKLFADPSETNLQSVLQDVDAVEVEINRIHNALLANPGSISTSTLEGLNRFERSIIGQFKIYFRAYSQANNLRNIPDQQNIDRVELLEKAYAQYEVSYQKIREAMAKMEDVDLFLKRQNETQRAIEEYSRLVESIEQALANPNAKIDTTIWVERAEHYRIQKAELEELLVMHGFDNQFYWDMLAEIDSFQDEYDFFKERSAELKHSFAVVKPTVIANREMVIVREDIEKLKIAPEEYVRILNSFEGGYIKVDQDIQIIGMQLTYKDLSRQNKLRFAQQSDYETGLAELRKITMQMKTLIPQMETFIAENQEYKGLIQPMGLGKLIGLSNLYYDIAEMYYVMAVDPDVNMLEYFGMALDNYRLSLQYDPTFYMKDAALYNIGFLSSYLRSKEFDVRYDTFYEANPNAPVRPADLQITEDYYSEAINAYNEIAVQYPNSYLYDDAVYLLGMLYFNIGADASETTTYYAKAREYFDILINKSGSKYEYDALYRRAETYSYSLDSESLLKATEDFIALINAIGQGKITDQTRIDEYTNFALQFIPYCIIAIDGADFKSKAKGATIISQYERSFRNRDLLFQIIDEVIDQKLKLNAPRQAIDFMEARMSIDPMSINNPSRLDSIRTAYFWYQNDLRENENITDIRAAIDQTMITSYGRSSAWFEMHKADDISSQLVLIKRSFDDIEARLIDSFSTNPTLESLTAYRSHITLYAEFKELHGEGFDEWYLGKQLDNVALFNQLAERTGDLQHYLAAIKNMQEYNDANAQNARHFTHEGLAHQYARYILENFGGQNQTSADTLDTYKYYRTVASRYLANLISERYISPDNVKLYASLLLGLADLEYAKNNPAQAQQDYAAILALDNEYADPFKLYVYQQMAYIAEGEKNFTLAEDWYRKALPFATSAKEADDINSNILAMINESRKKAESDKNYLKLASESLRLSESYASKDPAAAEIFKMAAQKAYKDAKEYEKSIGILMEVAASKKDVKEVYTFYYSAWNIADSLMAQPAVSDSLKQQFITRFPASNESFMLKVAAIQKLAKDPLTMKQAGDQYLALHDDVVANKIDSGSTTSDQIYLEAIAAHQTSADDNKFEELLRSFAQLYPRNEKAMQSLEILADRAFARKDTLRYDQLAKEIYDKDRANSSRYKFVAERNLGAIETEFYNAYVNLDWQLAFRKRDEFKKLEAEYIKEGLKIDTKPTYEMFTQAEADHKKIQDRIKFLASYDTQIAALENGFPRRKATDLIMVNPNTTWGNHLTGGKDNRIAAMGRTVEAEIAKVRKLQESAAAQNVDQGRWIRAWLLIARINEHAANVISAQIDRYMSVSNEFSPFRNNPEDVERWNNAKAYYMNPFKETALGYHYSIYMDYGVPGFQDKNIAISIDELKKANWLPELVIDTYPLDRSWSVQTVDNNTQRSFTLTQPVIGKTSSRSGLELSSIDMPQNTTLVIKREFNAKVVPDAAYLNFVYPEEVKINLNGTEVKNLAYVPIDTLVVGKPVTTRYSISIPGDYMKEGANEIELRFANTLSEPQKLHFVMQVASNKEALSAFVPLETVVYHTDGRWKVTYSPDPEAEPVTIPAIPAQDFGISKENITDMLETKASAIWVPETAEVKHNQLTFEYEFDLDSEFRSGYMLFVAPEDATIILNDQTIIEENYFDFDPEPLTVYSTKYDFQANQIQAGKNTIKVSVDNKTAFRGFLAEISITKVKKEVN